LPAKLDSEDTFATTLILSLHKLLGEQFYYWEPDTVNIELERRNIHLPEINAAKLQAAITLLFVPSFFWDAVAYEKTCLAFNNILPNPDALQEASPAQLSWGVIEATEVIRRHDRSVPKIDHESIHYTAVVLHREGFLIAPNQLQFAQERLDQLNCCDNESLRNKTEERWRLLTPTSLPSQAFTEDPVDIQLARLSAVELYIQQRQKELTSQLSEFTSRTFSLPPPPSA